jgi:tRNA(fMet)-specific endonuclease VapC
VEYLLDTNIIISYLKNEEKIVNLIKNLSQINISVITVGEMYYGAKNSNNSEVNFAKYRDFFSYCNILNISENTTHYYSDIRFRLKNIGKPIPENDIWIAANAQEYLQTIVTRDKHLLNIDFIKTALW